MSRRSSAGWLIGGVTLLTGLGLAGALFPIRACRTCDGLAQWLHGISSPSIPPRPPPRIDCPDCGDRGKVSLFRSWMRPRVSVTIAAVLRGLKDPEGMEAYRALRRVVQESGADYADFHKTALLEVHGMPRAARFVESEEKRYLVLFADSGSGTIPGSMGVTVLLLSAEGRALDFVDVFWSSRRGPIWGIVDGAQVVIQAGERSLPTSEAAFQVTQWRQERWEGKTRGNALCRLAIRGDRFEIR